MMHFSGREAEEIYLIPTSLVVDLWLGYPWECGASEFVDLKLDESERVSEIARMLGARDTRSAVNHARELLAAPRS